MTDAAELLRRHLRQRRELGESELLLERLTAPELLELVRDLGAPAVPVDVAAPARSATEAAEAPPIERNPRELDAGAPAPGPAETEIVQLGDLARLRATALGCPRCRLAETRRQVVFGEGNERADLMVVGEAPGADEDRTGRPFVGRAGKLLDRLLRSIGFSRESVYICNVLKCRPPANRNPQPEEIEACSPYLRRQVELVAPRAILTLGTFAAQTLLGSTDPIGTLRGRVHRYQATPLVPTYHPAALLRNPGWTRPAWDDLQLLRALLDGDVPSA